MKNNICKDCNKEIKNKEDVFHLKTYSTFAKKYIIIEMCRKCYYKKIGYEL